LALSVTIAGNVFKNGLLTFFTTRMNAAGVQIHVSLLKLMMKQTIGICGNVLVMAISDSRTLFHQ
jgi:hypothetical protein